MQCTANSIERADVGGTEILMNQVAVKALELKLCVLEATLHAVLPILPALVQTLKFDVKQTIPQT